MKRNRLASGPNDDGYYNKLCLKITGLVTAICSSPVATGFLEWK
jgi:hypothetical protein